MSVNYQTKANLDTEYEEVCQSMSRVFGHLPYLGVVLEGLLVNANKIKVSLSAEISAEQLDHLGLE